MTMNQNRLPLTGEGIDGNRDCSVGGGWARKLEHALTSFGVGQGWSAGGLACLEELGSEASAEGGCAGFAQPKGTEPFQPGLSFAQKKVARPALGGHPKGGGHYT